MLIDQVLGRCRIVTEIGEGGLSTVYRAYDERLHGTGRNAFGRQAPWRD